MSHDHLKLLGFCKPTALFRDYRIGSEEIQTKSTRDELENEEFSNDQHPIIHKNEHILSKSDLVVPQPRK